MSDRPEYSIFDPVEIPCEEISDTNALAKEPLVSTLMLTYNHAPYVARAIEGVVQQKTNFAFELVIGEDCSTDGTREIVFDYAKRFPDIIRVITSEQNVGMKKNGYRTYQACRGKYVTYCEGDDYWHRLDKLQLQTDYLESHPDCGLVYSDHDRYFVKNGRTIRSHYRTTNNVPPKKLNVFRGWGPGLNILTCTVMVRSHLLNSIRSDPYLYRSDHYIGGGDIAFSEVALVSNIHYIDESLSTYTFHIESASNTRDPIKALRFSISVYEGYLYIAKKYEHYEEIPGLEERRIDACLWLAFWERNGQLARETRSKSASLSIKGRLLYYGAVNPLLHYMVCPLVIICKKMRALINAYQLFHR